jgi:ABC-type Fe3+/spermidine/putrescine transport system ATPase subunit
VTSPFVDVRDVTKRHGRQAVVNAVSLQVYAGESIVIVGPSGSGKTTLLRIIAGLETPDEGEVWLEGQCVSARRRIVVPPYQRGLGFVFQDLALWPHMTIAQHLEFVLRAGSAPRSERQTRIRDALTRTRIDVLAERYPHQLSGGEQQRGALARAIVTRPRLLLLDEPLSNLDPELRTMMRGELTRIRQELSLTVVHVTHDYHEAADAADRVVRMKAGRIESGGAGGARA